VKRERRYPGKTARISLEECVRVRPSIRKSRRARGQKPLPRLPSMSLSANQLAGRGPVPASLDVPAACKRYLACVRQAIDSGGTHQDEARDNIACPVRVTRYSQQMQAAAQRRDHAPHERLDLRGDRDRALTARTQQSAIEDLHRDAVLGGCKA
jgi:hypothetical protein